MASSVDQKDRSVGEVAWRSFVLTFLLVLAGGLAVLYALIIAVDPYDTGRFPTFMPPGVSDVNQQTANASSGRNPIFNAAVFFARPRPIADLRRWRLRPRNPHGPSVE